MAPYVERPAEDGERNAAGSPRQDPLERQRELNDNLTLIHILDDPAPHGEFAPFSCEPVLGNHKYRRQTLLNFLAFCLARDGAAVALTTTIQPARPTQLVLHVARGTGGTPPSERARTRALLAALKRAWKFQTYGHVQAVLAHVVCMTAPTLRRRLKKLRGAVHELQAAHAFAGAVAAWGKQEVSPEVFRWMHTWQCESQTAALKDVFQHLAASIAADDFDTPALFTVSGCFRLYHSYFFPIAVLVDSQFLREVEFGLTSLPPDVVHQLRRLRRRCVKLRWYDIGVHLLCTYARDAVRRILGADAFTRFLCRDDDALRIDWLEAPEAQAAPMARTCGSAQDALLGVLAGLSEDPGCAEPFACTIAHRPAAFSNWTPWCVPVYHPELQVVDYLRRRALRPSAAYVGCSQLACRLCKFYVDCLGGPRWSLHTAGLDTMDLKVPEEWLIPPTDAGAKCASIVREEAARLVLREDNVQRIAWEMRYATDAMGLGGGQTAPEADINFNAPVLDISC